MAPFDSPGVRLYLVSFGLLFTELVLIRWIPANVTYVGFFSNFLLMGSFLGIGVGILAGRRSDRPILPFGLFIPVLLIVVKLVTTLQLNVQLRSADEIFFGLAENSRSADINFVVLPIVVGLTALVMALLAMPLAKLLSGMRPLRAYTIDILGSISGIALFTILSALSTPPPVWFGALALLLFGLVLGKGINAWGSLSGVMMVLILITSASPSIPGWVESWSPYYRIDLKTADNFINVNGIPHQTVWDVNDPRKEGFYEQVYKWLPDRTFDRVLVVGAGNGVDVSLALKHGAQRVDAAEIDPGIAKIGRELSPQKPYSDPRVDLHVNDGRNFLATTDRTFDLVVFALPDSLTLVSSAANVRLESFLFTREAFETVRSHLAPDGVFVLYNYYRQPWLIQRISGMLTDVFGEPPVTKTYNYVSAALAAGPGVSDHTALKDTFETIPADPQYRPATDDWPFLYLREPSIAPYYLAALAAIFLAALAAVLVLARTTGTSLRRFSPHFFALGAAFLLLETRSIVTFSLLFGSTWLTNAMAFGAILVSVLLAIQVNARWPLRDPRPIYVLLFAALAIGWLLPPERLLIDPPILRYTLSSAIAFAPVFLANLIFTRSFRDTKTADMAFAANLLGAVFGGALEYSSLLFGHAALYPLAAVLYALAWLFAERFRVLADRELAIAPAAA
jgi:hypothetical protein